MAAKAGILVGAIVLAIADGADIVGSLLNNVAVSISKPIHLAYHCEVILVRKCTIYRGKGRENE